ncbi:MAG: tRNA glutamyl-Q(34) synthetase GluQRS [Lysobacteraceae bacterium]|nr:MAG: tRNA glutamyl-Q(34) synthetase GluQRS [Xanthomonadaceae bacterium]
MPVQDTYRGRFAPSPTGPLHLGSLATALGSWLLARRARGEWWIRVEDLDPPREVPGASARQLATLAAFGLHADGEVVWQSVRGALYQSAVDRLLDEGKAFHCHCSRAELATRNGVHHRCIGRKQRVNPAIRLCVTEDASVSFEDGLQGTISQDVWREVGDFVLRRADGLWAYQLAVVVDDAAQGMTDIVRGADLLESTPRQILLQRALGLATPRYLHLPLITDATGNKLSKSGSAIAVDAARPLPAMKEAWRALGQQDIPGPEASNAAAFLAACMSHFQPARLPRAPSVAVAAPHNGTDTNAD